MYDVIVVGARCGGAPTAMLLARLGYRVLLVDRATFPSEIPHGHFIHRHGPRCLARWGVIDRIVSGRCPAVTTTVVDLGDFPLIGEDLIVDGVAFGYGPRRWTLDHVLVDTAVEAGVELRQGFHVEGIVAENECVTGIRGRSHATAPLVVERARITVGADGRRSTIAVAVNASVYDAQPAAACWYFSYWSGVASRGLEHYNFGNRVLFAFPTDDALVAIFAGWPIDELPRVRANIDGEFRAAIDGVPDFAERVACGRREERYSSPRKA